RAFEAEDMVLVTPGGDRRARGAKPLGERVGTQHVGTGEDFSNAQLSAPARVGERSVKLRMTPVGMTGNCKTRGILRESGNALRAVRSDTDDETHRLSGFPAELACPSVGSLERRRRFAKSFCAAAGSFHRLAAVDLFARHRN